MIISGKYKNILKDTSSLKKKMTDK